MDECILKVENLKQYFPVEGSFGKNKGTVKAVDGISFSVGKGEFCVIVGPSGAGKTTVLNILGGMDSCDGGKILLDNLKVHNLNERQLTDYRRYQVGFVFQLSCVGNFSSVVHFLFLLKDN